MKKQVRIHHLKSDEVEIELFADYEFIYGDVDYYVKFNGCIFSDEFACYYEARDEFIRLANSWGWTTSDCERS